MKNSIKRDLPWLVTLAIAILILPAILTQPDISIFDFSKSGQIGDTIGGITSPVIGLIAAYLVFLAFKEQINSNKIQLRNTEFSIALKLIDDLESMLNEQNKEFQLSGDGKPKKTNYYEIIRLWNEMDRYRFSYIKLIVILVRQVNFLKNFIKESSNLSISDQGLLLEKAGIAFGILLDEVFEILIMTESSARNEQEKQFYLFCKKFKETTLEELLFHSINMEDFEIKSYKASVSPS